MMRKQRSFRPSVSDVLEDRTVPSGLMGHRPGSVPAALGDSGVRTLSHDLDLLRRITDLSSQIQDRLRNLQSTHHDNIRISDMFKMQMLMNRLSQLSEMSSSVVSASNSAISNMARNVKS